MVIDSGFVADCSLILIISTLGLASLAGDPGGCGSVYTDICQA